MNPFDLNHDDLDAGARGRTAPRRRFLFAAVAAAAALAAPPGIAARRPLVQVWKSPSCGCCHLWVEHLQAEGFDVQVFDSGNTAVRARLGVPQALGSCHSARVDGYAIEGHVPAADIHRLLRERPAAVGLAVPGMPIGSPGMDGPEYGPRRDAYDVLLVLRDGSTRVFQSHG